MHVLVHLLFIYEIDTEIQSKIEINLNVQSGSKISALNYCATQSLKIENNLKERNEKCIIVLITGVLS